MVSKVKHSILSVSWQVCLCSLVCYILLSMFLLCHSIQLMLFFLLLKKIFVFRKRILSGNVDPDLVVCITIGWMPIKHKYQFVCPVKHNQLVSLVLTRNIVLQNQNFELIMCLYIFDFFFLQSQKMLTCGWLSHLYFISRCIISRSKLLRYLQRSRSSSTRCHWRLQQ